MRHLVPPVQYTQEDLWRLVGAQRGYDMVASQCKVLEAFYFHFSLRSAQVLVLWMPPPTRGLDVRLTCLSMHFRSSEYQTK